MSAGRSVVAKARGRKTRQFTEGQLEMLDTRVEIEVRRITDKIYDSLRKRFYPKGGGKVVFEAAATSHRLHSAYRAAVSQVDVTAIRSRVAHRLETMVTGGDHSENVGFDFLLNLGAKGTGLPSVGADTDEKEADEDASGGERGVDSGASASASASDGASSKKRLRGAALWRHIVRKKHWKALLPYEEPGKPWDELKFVRLPTKRIDIRQWTREHRAMADARKQARIEWMRGQWSSGDWKKQKAPEAAEGSAHDAAAATSNPAYRVLKKALAAYGKRAKRVPEPRINATLSDKKSWEDIVASLQAQGVLGRNFLSLWQRRAAPGAPSSSTETKPPRLGRYLAPDRSLVNPSSTGTLDDYYSALVEQSPEMKLPRVSSAVRGDDSATFARSRRDSPGRPPPPPRRTWFAVPTGLAPSAEGVLPCGSSMRAQASPKGGSESPGGRLGGVHSAGPAAPLPSSAFAPRSWNSSRSRGGGGGGGCPRWAAFLPVGASLGEGGEGSRRPEGRHCPTACARAFS